MNKLEIEQIRQKLLALRSELQELEDSSRQPAEPMDQDQLDTGRLSRRDALQAQIAAEEGSRQRKRWLQKIDGALRRIQSGDFGRCFICEEELDPSCLSEDPTTTRCMDCIEEE